MIKHTGYIPGGGLLSPNRDMFYLNIPKNASTYLSNLLFANNWTHWNMLDHPITVTHSVAIIRDPIDRWISGFATYAALHLCGYNYGSDHFVIDYNDLTERLIFNQVILDDHTDLQINFVNQIALHNPLYLRYNKNLIKQINASLDMNLNTNVAVDDNSTDSNYDTQQISQFMKNRLHENPDLKAKVIAAYQDDYDFIRHIEFYNDPR